MGAATLQTGIFHRKFAAGRAMLARPAAAMLDSTEHWLFSQRENLFLWVPVAFGAGIAAWFQLPGTMAWTGFCLVMAALALTFWLAGGKTYLLARLIVVACLAALAGCCIVWAKSSLIAAPVLERPAIVRFDAEIIGVETLAARGTIRLLVEPDPAAQLPPLMRINLPMTVRGAGDLLRGDHIRARARLMPPPRAGLPGGYDFARRAWFERIGAVGTILGQPQRFGPDRRARSPGLRARLSAHIQSRVPGGAGAIAAAFATGDRGGISLSDDEAMRRAGLAHLLSISGLHVSAAVAGAMWLVLRLLALSPWLALRLPLVTVSAGVGALTGLGYTLLTGSEVPTIRSLVAALLVLLAFTLGREALTLRLVAAGALFVLCIWPEALIGPSFQLSFAAVTAIVALHNQPMVMRFLARSDEPLLLRWLRSLAGLLLTGIAVELALMPIALFHFHQSGIYGAAANIIAIPLTTFIVMPAEALALALDSIGLGAPAWWVVDQSLSAMLTMAHYIAASPGVMIALPTMPVAAFFCMMSGGLWLLLWDGKGRLIGMIPLVAGLFWAASVGPPDLLITGDGRHVASRGADGRTSLLRARAGDFVRDQLAEAAGIQVELGDLVQTPGVRCSPDFCVWQMERRGKIWTIMAARSSYRTDWQPLVDACARSDIVIAERWLPRGCTPRWLKVDRQFLERHGGLAITLDAPSVRSVGDGWRGRPWITAPTIMPPREGGLGHRNAAADVAAGGNPPTVQR
jgi:competence protein ComEC